MNTKTEIRQLLEQSFETNLSQVYFANNIKTGDISPEQQIEWNRLLDEITTLFYSLMEQNKGDKENG